jgi:very-short-patch-repair endonuclease
VYSQEWLKEEGLVWTGKSLPFNPKLKDYASDMRKEMTKEENHLWYDYLSKLKSPFLRQKIIGHYIVDFYCAKHRLVIEVDGSQHYTHEGMTYDQIRTEYLIHFELNILRFSNNDVTNKFEAVCRKIDGFFNEPIER